VADEDAQQDQAQCDDCGAPATAGWLGIMTWRDDGGAYKDNRIDTRDLGFCSEEHAGRYFLEGRLPAPDFSERERLPRTWRDRLLDASVLGLFVFTAALVVLGAWTLVNWIRR
jgi:hypothetical protein